MANKIKFEGLVAYNYAVKLVKKNISENNITLKKGSSIGLAKDCTFRDVVKKSWLQAKGKPKRSYKKIINQTVQDCLKAFEGQSKQAEKEGTGLIANFHYWELDDYISLKVGDNEQINIDNSNYGGIPDLEGVAKEIEEDLSEIFFELNQLSNLRKWDSSSAPTYNFYFDEKTKQFNFVLQNNEDGRDAELTSKLETLEDFEKTDLKSKTGVKKEKSDLDKKLKEQEVRKEKLKVDKIEIENLEKIKSSLERSFDRYAIMKDKKGMESTMKKISKIDDKLSNL